MKFDVWPWKTIGHLYYATSSSMHHFVAIGEFSWSYSPETPNLGQMRRFLEPCDFEIWRMTLKNNRAPLLCCFQLCAWFHCHMWIQTGVRVRKRLSWVLTSVTLTFCMDITFDHGNNSWKFHDDTMMGTWWKRCDRQTDGQTDRQTDGRTENTICRAARSQLKIQNQRDNPVMENNVSSSWRYVLPLYMMDHCWVIYSAVRL